MRYTVEFMPEATRALRKMSPEVARRVTGKIERMRNGLVGDVKRLTNFTPEYRLRVGDWRVFFEIEGAAIVVYAVRHRSTAYD
jgi:mRNA interferase RelE/StbE